MKAKVAKGSKPTCGGAACSASARALRSTSPALTGHSPFHTTAAVRPVNPDIRCDGKIRTKLNSQYAGLSVYSLQLRQSLLLGRVDDFHYQSQKPVDCQISLFRNDRIHLDFNQPFWVHKPSDRYNRIDGAGIDAVLLSRFNRLFPSVDVCQDDPRAHDILQA